MILNRCFINNLSVMKDYSKMMSIEYKSVTPEINNNY